jgi:EmrB/QacA subfamily drug resistance transporter
MPIVAVGVLLSGFDLFVVNVALDRIAASIGGSNLADLSWVLNAYTITFAALLVPAGRIGDMVGSKRGFLTGLVTFVVASALCAVSPNLWTLVAFRIVQAGGAAVMIPSSLGLILAVTPAERRAGAVRTWASLGGVGAALGPVVGGLLVQADWRWVFLINIPTGLAAAVLGWRFLPATERHQDSRPGIGGGLALVVTVAALVTGLVNGSQWGWLSLATIASFTVAVAGVMFNAFQTARAVDPIVDLEVLRLPHFTAVSVNLLVFHVAFGAMLLSIVLWLEHVWGYSALRTGLAVAPGPLLVPVVAAYAGRITARVGTRPTIAAGGVIFGLGLLAWAVWADGAPGYATAILPGLVLTGVGVGLAVPSAMALGSSGLPPQRFSTGSAVLSTARQIGIAIGIALAVAILQSRPGVDGFHSAWIATAAVALVASAGMVTRKTS